MPQSSVKFEWLGLTDFQAGLHFQKRAWDHVHGGGEPLILGLEHSSVITLGKRADPQLDLKVSLEVLKAMSIQVEPIDRGGEAVLHSPGQLVIYPIIPLELWNLSVRDFVGLLEKTTIRFLSELGVKAHSGIDEPGIYTAQGKIGFVGIRIDRGISRHGIAVNVSNDLTLFNLIRCCGKENEKFDRLANYGVNASQMQIFKRWSQNFKWSLNLTEQSPKAYSGPADSTWSLGSVGSAFI